MKKTKIRKRALEWFNSKFQVENAKVYTSKFYPPEESWSKTRVWFFQISVEAINSLKDKSFYLICENNLSGEPFICFKVTSGFFLKNLDSFDVDQEGKLARIYLSAEAANMFKEVRGKGEVDFRPFLIE